MIYVTSSSWARGAPPWRKMTTLLQIQTPVCCHLTGRPQGPFYLCHNSFQGTYVTVGLPCGSRPHMHTLPCLLTTQLRLSSECVGEYMNQRLQTGRWLQRCTVIKSWTVTVKHCFYNNVNFKNRRCLNFTGIPQILHSSLKWQVHLEITRLLNPWRLSACQIPLDAPSHSGQTLVSRDNFIPFSIFA